mgnify:CR=1 FL=1
MKIIWKCIFHMEDLWTRKIRNEKGQALSEYAIIIGVVAVLIIATLVLFRDALSNLFTRIINQLNGVSSS